MSCIPDFGFHECTDIYHITIPSSIKLIGYAAFGDNGLSSLELENGILSIGDVAFAGSPIKNI